MESARNIAAAQTKKLREYVKPREYLSGEASLRVRNISERRYIYGDERRAEMERLTEMYGGMMVPRKACTFDREGGADDCKECTEICEDEGGVCRTCILQECLARLGEYEDTGLTPEQIMELKERDTAKAPEIHKNKFSDAYTCPSCNLVLINKDEKGWFCGKHYKFCPDCGQRLKWRE